MVVYSGGREDATRVADHLRRVTGLEVSVYELPNGYAAVPGFVDAHLHLGSLGMSLHGISLHNVTSVEELKEIVRREAARFGGWVYGRGWDQDRMGAWPTRWDLDEAVPDKPVVLVRVCGHVAVLNTVAMRRLGLLESSDPRIDRGCNGEPTGIVYEELVARAMAEAKKSVDAREAVLEASKLLLSRGVTTVGDMDVDEHWLTGLFSAWSRGELRLRVRAYLRYTLFNTLAELGVRGGFGDNMLRVVGVKLFADGSLGARTARLSRPYNDDPSKRGVLLMDWRRVAEVARRAVEAGYDVAVHAIGDEALDHVLKGFREAGCSCRVEHASLVRDDQVEPLKGLRAAVQPRFIASDYWLRERLGDRIRLAYRFKTIMRVATMGFSSDAPVEDPNPLENIYLAVDRDGLKGFGEELTVEEAFYAHTRGAALVLKEPGAGCLDPGCYADIAVLSSDPFTVEPRDIPSLSVEATIVAGETVYERL